MSVGVQTSNQPSPTLNELPNLTPAYQVALRQRGIQRIAELRRVPKASLVAHFGKETGKKIWRTARGLTSTPPPSTLSKIRNWLIGSTPRRAKTGTDAQACPI